MLAFDPKDLALWTNGTWLSAPPKKISGFCFDARRIKQGECFIALSNGKSDGHNYIGQAVKAGAVAAIVERTQSQPLPLLKVRDSLRALSDMASFVRREFSKPVIAVTGSSGKTSTKEMLRILLGRSNTHATRENWNNLIGVPMTLLDLEEKKHDFAVIEAGINQPGEMDILGRIIRADLNLLTNIGPAHLELLHNEENIALEKSYLAKYAVEGSSIILTYETLANSAYKALINRAIVLIEDGEVYSLSGARAVISYALSPNSKGGQILTIDNKRYNINSRSRGMATNAALAIIAAYEMGVASRLIRERIESWRPLEHRGQVIKTETRTFYVDCYNANPSSMVDAFHAFDQSSDRDVPRFYILGAMDELGEATIERHTWIGAQLVLRSQDRAVFVGPDTLTHAYFLGVLSNGAREDQLKCTDSVQNVMSCISSFSGAIFLKGSRNYQLEKLLPSFNIKY